MPAVRAGLLSLTVDGTAFDVASDWNWGPDNDEPTTLNGMTSAAQGLSVEPKPGFISATVRVGSFSISEVKSWRSVRVVATTRYNTQVVGIDMAVVGSIEINGVDGTFALRFEGPSVQESAI